MRSLVLVVLVVLIVPVCRAQSVVENPTASQTIFQPQGPPQTSLFVNSLDNVQVCDVYHGTSIDAQISNCLAGLPNGGIADARGFHGSFTAMGAVTFPNVPIRLLLGAVTITGTNTNTIFTLSSGSQIVGLGAGNTVVKTGAGNVPAILATNVNDVDIEGVEIVGNGGVSGQVCVQYQGVTRGYFRKNYVHGCGTTSFGLDTNSPSVFSKDVWVSGNEMGTTLVNTAIANIQVGPNASSFYIDHNVIRETQSGQIGIDVDGATDFEISDNNVWCGSGTNGIQIEATDGSPVKNWKIINNRVDGCQGSQGGITVAITGAKAMTDGLISGNTLTNNQLIVMNFNGNSSGVIQRIKVTGNTMSGSIINLWQHQGGTFSDIQVSNNTVSGFGSGGGIWAHADTANISDLTVFGNRVTGGTGTATGLLLSGTINSPLIYGNDFEGNAGGDIADSSTTTSFDPWTLNFTDTNTYNPSSLKAAGISIVQHANAVDSEAPNIQMTSFNALGIFGLEYTSTLAGQFYWGLNNGSTTVAEKMKLTNSGLTLDGTLNLSVGGSLTVSGSKNFKIDHPLDPANKYLYHSSVESPDMMNLYNGTVVLDRNGEAWVSLPDYFEALNEDFQYQLTPVGAPARGLYVAKEIAGNKFKIAGGRPGIKVSWQVTGIRHDAFANVHRARVEEEKVGNERGHYMHPELFETAEETGVSAKAKP